MANSTIKCDNIKFVDRVTGTTAIDISNVKATEFLVFVNYNDNFCYSFSIPSAELSATNKRLFNGYGYQGNTNLISIFASSSQIYLSEFSQDGNDRKSSAIVSVYCR